MRNPFVIRMAHYYISTQIGKREMGKTAKKPGAEFYLGEGGGCFGKKH